MSEEAKKPTIIECRVAINELTKGMLFDEDELQHRSRLLFMIHRLNFFTEMPVFLEELEYQKKLGAKQNG